MADELTDKQRLFVEEYLTCWNATEAARRAGYSPASARQMGSENLSKPYIAAEIKARIEEKAMGADEVISGVAAYARLDISPFIRFNGRSKTPYVDVKALIAAGHGYAIKGVTKTKFGTNVEFYDRFAALQLMGKHHKLFVDRHEVAATVEVKDTRVDLKKLSKDELNALEGLLARATGDAGEPGESGEGGAGSP